MLVSGLRMIQHISDGDSATSYPACARGCAGGGIRGRGTISINYDRWAASEE